MSRSWCALVTLSVLGLVACTGGSSGGTAAPTASGSGSPSSVVAPTASSASKDAVPWLDAPATAAQLAVQLRPAKVASVSGPACRVGDLRVSAGDSDGAGGHLFYFVNATNTSTRRCVLAGYPSITSVVDGRTQPLTLKHGTVRGLGEVIRVALTPGAQAIGYLDLYERVEDCPGQTGAPLRDVSVARGSQHAVVISKLARYCSLTLSSWRPSSDPSNAAAPRVSRQLEGLYATLEGVPATSRSGAVVTFDVALNNASRGSISLRPCPIYEIDGVGKPTIYHLNCAAHPRIAAGATVRFAMQVTLDPAGPPATLLRKLSWRIPGSDVIATRAP